MAALRVVNGHAATLRMIVGMRGAGQLDAVPAEGLTLHADDALLVVDMQCDFLPGGSLPVSEGGAVLAPIRALVERFSAKGLPIIASRDWHPPDHVSFRAAGGRWPPHCVAGTPGAQLAPGLRLPPQAIVVSKGTARDRDAYSAFDHTDLHRMLRARHVRRLFVAGVATEYCVSSTVTDALALGYAVVVLTDAVAAVDLAAGDGTKALETMRSGGARLGRSDPLTA